MHSVRPGTLYACPGIDTEKYIERKSKHTRGRTDSTIAPTQNSDFLSRTFHGSQHEEECHEKKIYLRFFLVCSRLSNDYIGMARGTVLREINPGAGFKPGDFVKKKSEGGYRRATRRVEVAGCSETKGRDGPRHRRLGA